MEINKKIEHYTHQRYPITYVSKGKRKLQTPAKTRVESSTNPSYHYTPRSAINITSTGTATSNTTSAFGQFPFQIIVINQPPINLIAKFIQLPLQLPPQQPIQQQPLQLLPQQPNLDPMAYAPIAKLDKFNGEEDDAQVWLNNMAKAITANNWDNTRAMQVISYFLQDITDAWYQSLAVKPQNFNGFKTEFLWYFSNNNSINKLANTFTTIRQEDTKAVTTYLERFHKNLRQIQAIQADYFTVPHILNQFIRGLHSSILQQICLMHPINLPTTVTYVRDFKAAKLEVNHAQAVNLAINGSSELDSKLKQFSDSINQKLEKYLADNCTIYQSSQWFPDSKPLTELKPIPIHLPAYDAPTNLLTTSLSTTAISNLSDTVTSNISTTATSNLSNTHHSNTTSKPSSNNIREPKIEDHPKLEISNGCTSTDPQLFPLTNRIFLLVTLEDAAFSNQRIKQQQLPINNIPPATITKNKSLDAIFLFELEEPSDMLLFSEAALEEKPITAMYTDAKVDGHSIKLILDSVDCAASTRIITVDGATKTPIGEIDDFPIKVNGIIVSIKVLMMEAIQYQALIEWSTHVSTSNVWSLQSYQHHKAYQVLWADEEHNKLWEWDKRKKGKEKVKEEEPLPTASYTSYTDTPPQLSSYC
ncbi:hypothetical protein G9A89_014061 [Geosiphon pyriformis]|nr:hypothetical protein G9A89_014061 [Geosiphon pyriformis]